VVAAAALRGGEELLLDYGDEYWRSRREMGLGAADTGNEGAILSAVLAAAAES
jgi:hypothetical protein